MIRSVSPFIWYGEGCLAVLCHSPTVQCFRNYLSAHNLVQRVLARHRTLANSLWTLISCRSPAVPGVLHLSTGFFSSRPPTQGPVTALRPHLTKCRLSSEKARCAASMA